MDASSDRDIQCRAQNEVAARAALGLCVGHSVTHAEWSAMRARSPGIREHFCVSGTERRLCLDRVMLRGYASVQFNP
jgi:hypothetical protein